METKDFKLILEDRLAKTRDTLVIKAKEYAHGDRLSNFKAAAVLLRTNPEKACAGLVIKHIVSLYDFISDLESGNFRDYAQWDEKIGDIIAYMCLLDAIVLERCSWLRKPQETSSVKEGE